MHEEAIGHKMELVAKPFDEYAVMADALIHVIEPTVMTVQSLFNAAKPLIQIPYEFLIHTASAPCER